MVVMAIAMIVLRQGDELFASLRAETKRTNTYGILAFVLYFLA